MKKMGRTFSAGYGKMRSLQAVFWRILRLTAGKQANNQTPLSSLDS